MNKYISMALHQNEYINMKEDDAVDHWLFIDEMTSKETNPQTQRVLHEFHERLEKGLNRPEPKEAAWRLMPERNLLMFAEKAKDLRDIDNAREVTKAKWKMRDFLQQDYPMKYPYYVDAPTRKRVVLLRAFRTLAEKGYDVAQLALMRTYQKMGNTRKMRAMAEELKNNRHADIENRREAARLLAYEDKKQIDTNEIQIEARPPEEVQKQITQPTIALEPSPTRKATAMADLKAKQPKSDKPFIPIPPRSAGSQNG